MKPTDPSGLEERQRSEPAKSHKAFLTNNLENPAIPHGRASVVVDIP